MIDDDNDRPAEVFNNDYFDVIIVGAGINGAGVFRDLCAQGVKCLLVEKNDFGSGTSAAPSRLIHGGLKYLETAEFRLVAESTYERNLLLKNASHLVKPLPTAIPILSWSHGVVAALRTFMGSTTAPRSRGALLVKFGLTLYDRYGSRQRQMPRHRMVSRRNALAQMPALTPSIVALGTYYDALVTAPERLVYELVSDGLALSSGSEAINGCCVAGRDHSAITLSLDCGITRNVRGKIVINAAGPWIDTVNSHLGINTSLIGGTKGSHILLEHDALLQQLDGRMLYFEADDGRILLVFPFQGRALVGSTDTPASNPDVVHCTQDEVDYFMQSLRELLPGLTFEKEQIVYSYSGIRPLPNQKGVEPGLISRDHSAPHIPANDTQPFELISLVGGKWTTFRAFSAEITDQVLEMLRRTRQCTTESMAIGGGRDMPCTNEERQHWLDVTCKASGVSRERVEVLLDRYGTTALELARYEGGTTATLINAPDFTVAEVDWLVRNERVRCMDDLLLRRTPLGIRGSLTMPLCQQIASICARVLSWDEARERRELDTFVALLAERHNVVLSADPTQ